MAFVVVVVAAVAVVVVVVVVVNLYRGESHDSSIK